MELNLQFFGGRGSAGGNSKESAVSTASGSKSERTAAAKRDVESGSGISATDLAKKYGLSSTEAGQIVYENATKNKANVQSSTSATVVKKTQKMRSFHGNSSKPTSEKTSAKRVDSLASKLASNPSSTIVGTRGNTTYVVEAEKIRTTYTRPNGVTVPASRTVYTVTTFVKGRSSASSQTLRSEEDVKTYMKTTAATWKSRKNRLSNKQKDSLF